MAKFSMVEALNQVREQDKDHEISMARGELEAIADKATQLSSALDGKSDDGNPLEAWVQSKITKAKDYINSVSDYMMYKPEAVTEAYASNLISKAKEIAKKMSNDMTGAVKEIEKLSKGLSNDPSVLSALQKANEDIEWVEENKISDIFKSNKEGDSVEDIAKRLKLSIKMVKRLLGEAQEEPKEEKDDKDDKELEDKDKAIEALKDQINILKTKLENEKHRAVKPEPNPKTGEVPLTIGVAAAEFKKEKEKKEVKENVSIKAYKNAVDPTKKGLMISKSGGMSGTIMIKDKKELKDLETKIAQAKKLYNIKETKKEVSDKKENKLVNEKLMNEISDKLKMKVALKKSKELGKKIKSYKDKVFKKTMSTIPSPLFANKDKDKAAREKRAKDMIKYYDAQKKAALKGPNKALAKKMLKNDVKKDDAYAIGMAQAKKSMNDEPPLDKKTITKGHEIAKKILKKENTSAFNPTVHNKTLGVTSKDLDRAFSKLSQKAQSHVNDLLRTGMGTRDAIKKAKEKFKENNINEDRRLYIESITGLKKKAEKSGMPYSILKKVYDRGMAAWKSGHRPGASQQQWAYARVNSFITKSSGTWGGADKDLAKQVKG